MPPDVQDEMAQGIRGALRVSLQECGHTAPLERPERVAALLRDWLHEGTD